MWIDSHARLDHCLFDPDRDLMLERAREAGVELVVAAAGPSRESIARTLRLAEQHDFVCAAVGVHPWDAGRVTADYWSDLERAVEHPKVVLIGEIGLEYRCTLTAGKLQREVFERQLALAEHAGLPVFTRCGGAWPDFVGMMQQRPAAKRRGIVGGFTGTSDQALECVSLGLLIAISGAITLPYARPARAAAVSLGLDQIVLESRAPAFAPDPRNGERNEPAAVAEIGRAAADLLRVCPRDLARNTNHNFRKLVNKATGSSVDTLVYTIGDRLYVNLTSECTARCVFCRRESEPVASGWNLRLQREHSIPEYIQAIGDPRLYREVVFCGFGEPTLRLAELIAIARVVKLGGVRVRLNTNGHGNLIHGRNIVPELEGCLDEISISLNAADEGSYARIVRPDSGPGTFDAVKDFAAGCRGHIRDVTLTVVELPGVDRQACFQIAADLGVGIRFRPYEEMVGSIGRGMQA
jgi:TatD DNase family protein